MRDAINKALARRCLCTRDGSEYLGRRVLNAPTFADLDEPSRQRIAEFVCCAKKDWRAQGPNTRYLAMTTEGQLFLTPGAFYVALPRRALVTQVFGADSIELVDSGLAYQMEDVAPAESAAPRGAATLGWLLRAMVTFVRTTTTQQTGSCSSEKKKD